MSELCANCKTATTCLEMGCGQGRRAAPAAAQLDAELPPLPKCVAYGIIGLTGIDPSDTHRQLSGVSVGQPGSWCKNSKTELYTAEQYRQGQRDAIAPYAERIRLLTEELENWKKSSRILSESRHRWKEAAKRAQQPTQTIDTPEFRALADKWQLCLTTDIERVYAELVAYIDGRTAGTAPEGYAIVPLVATKDMLHAGMRFFHDKREPASKAWEVYRAMIAAAPSPQENTKAGVSDNAAETMDHAQLQALGQHQEKP